MAEVTGFDERVGTAVLHPPEGQERGNGDDHEDGDERPVRRGELAGLVEGRQQSMRGVVSALDSDASSATRAVATAATAAMAQKTEWNP